eukprot:gene35534-46071_t
MSGRGKGLEMEAPISTEKSLEKTSRASLRAKVVLSFSLQKDQLSGDEFLILNDLPMEFIHRYGLIPSKIYNRRCYKQLYDITAGEMSSGRIEWGVTLYTGVSGIGKSLFLIYFIYRFLHDDRFPDKRFALQFREQTSLLFKPAPGAHVYTCSHRDADSIRNKNFLVLCDINNPVEPASRAKWLVIFSTPNPARYKECMKNAPTFRYTLPTWSEQELTSCDSRVQLWYDNLVRWGGVPRHVLSANNAAQLLALQLETAESHRPIITELFKFGLSAMDLIQNSLLIHINPPPPLLVSPSSSDSDDFQYDGVPIYSFASDHVFQLLVSKYSTMLLAQAADVFNADVATSTHGSASTGHLFEKVCLWLKPLEGHRFTAAALLGTGADGETKEFVEARLLRPNIHYLPRISNKESGDSFYLTESSSGGAGEYLLVVFQITVAEKHEIARKALVFLTPKHGRMSTVQAIVAQRESAMVEARSPQPARGFEQYVYRREI